MKTWLTVSEAAEVLGSEPGHDLHGMRTPRDPARAHRRATGHTPEAGMDRRLVGTAHPRGRELARHYARRARVGVIWWSAKMMPVETIYVYLVDEGVDCWRPSRSAQRGRRQVPNRERESESQMNDRSSQPAELSHVSDDCREVTLSGDRAPQWELERTRKGAAERVCISSAITTAATATIRGGAPSAAFG